jgi:hypothetical protein
MMVEDNQWYERTPHTSQQHILIDRLYNYSLTTSSTLVRKHSSSSNNSSSSSNSSNHIWATVPMAIQASLTRFVADHRSALRRRTAVLPIAVLARRCRSSKHHKWLACNSHTCRSRSPTRRTQCTTRTWPTNTRTKLVPLHRNMQFRIRASTNTTNMAISTAHHRLVHRAIPRTSTPRRTTRSSTRRPVMQARRNSKWRNRARNKWRNKARNKASLAVFQQVPMSWATNQIRYDQHQSPERPSNRCIGLLCRVTDSLTCYLLLVAWLNAP